jgi:hypothetical protein
MDYIELSEILEFLADLTLDAPTPEIAVAALRLQTALSQFYFPVK